MGEGDTITDLEPLAGVQRSALRSTVGIRPSASARRLVEVRSPSSGEARRRSRGPTPQGGDRDGHGHLIHGRRRFWSSQAFSIAAPLAVLSNTHQTSTDSET